MQMVPLSGADREVSAAGCVYADLPMVSAPQQPASRATLAPWPGY